MGHPVVYVRFLSPHPTATVETWPCGPFWTSETSCLRKDGLPRFGVGSMGEEKNWIANMELDNEGHVAMSCAKSAGKTIHESDFPVIAPVEVGW